MGGNGLRAGIYSQCRLKDFASHSIGPGQSRNVYRIVRNALGVVAEIEQNTKPIWEINATNKVAGDLLAGAKAIEANAGAIVGALSAADKNRAA